jgi:ER-bound oxygenase mpaB/B'/Rubber oxygenase, catalytic domain
MAGAHGGSRWTDELLKRKREQGDQFADDVIEAVFQQGNVNAVNAVMRTLVSNDQPVPASLPVEVQDYLAKNMTLPEWADPDKIKRGQQLFETWGLQISLCLFCASLPSAYAAAKGVKVLFLTARLDTDARRRVMETGQFLINVLAVGSFEEHGKGFRTIQHVRLMHAAVRKLIEVRNVQQPGLWDPNWGIPINQEDLAGTMLSFSYVPVDPLRRLGVHVSAKDADAYLHLWNVIGHLLGLHDDMRVLGIDDATALVETIRHRQFTASLEGQHMTAALMALLNEMTPFHKFDETIPPLIRHLIGDEIADMLLVPASSLTDDLGRLQRIANWFWVRIFGRTERESPCYQRVTALIRPFGHDLFHGLFRLQRGGQRAPFDIPDHLARSWELSA